MKRFLHGVAPLIICVIGVAIDAAAETITIGIANVANCYPLMCNDSGNSPGPSILYQQVYASSEFPTGDLTIVSETFYSVFAQAYGGTNTLLGGTYNGFLSYSSNPVGALDRSCADCNVGSGYTQVFSVTIPTGGVPFSNSYTFNNNVGFFVYNPINADLLLTIIVMDQDNVPNFSGNSYNDADDTGAATSRAWFLGNGLSDADSAGLVTTFNVPEPSTFFVTGSCIFGLAVSIACRKSCRRRSRACSQRRRFRSNGFLVNAFLRSGDL